MVDGDPPANQVDTPSVLRDHLTSHYDQLLGRLTGHLGCPHLAADSLHDTWIRLERKKALASVQNPGAYVFRMACNVAADRMRAERLHSYPDADLEVEGVADGAPGPAAIAESRAEVRALIEALEHMPRRRRAIFEALRIEGMMQGDVAARYGVSLGMVKREAHKAQAACAQRLHWRGDGLTAPAPVANAGAFASPAPTPDHSLSETAPARRRSLAPVGPRP